MASFTKKEIIASFVKLLDERPLNKITVKDIVEDCGINRSTFYYYYSDVYALLREVLSIETEKALNLPPEQFTWEEGFYNSTTFAREHRKAIYNVYRSISREFLDEYLYAVFENIITNVVRCEIKQYNVSDNDIRIIIDFYKYAFVGMVYKWLESGMKYDYDKEAHRLLFLMKDNILYNLIKADPQYIVKTEIIKNKTDRN